MGCVCSVQTKKANNMEPNYFNNIPSKNEQQGNDGANQLESSLKPINTSVLNDEQKKIEDHVYTKQNPQSENWNYDVKESDSISNENLNKLSLPYQKRNRPNMFVIDQNNKALIFKNHVLGSSMEVSPKVIGPGINAALRNINSQELKPNDYLKDRVSMHNPNNVYEIIFDDPVDYMFDLDEIYYEMNDIQLKKYEDFLENNKSIEENGNNGINGFTQPINNMNNNSTNTGNTGKTSTLMEWSKILQKNFSNYEKSSININDNKNKLFKVYQIILSLKERYWYEEAALLYKERYTASKNINNMTTLTFDRKMIQLHEQFRWLINAVANIKLNFNSLIGVSEFPPLKVQAKMKRENSTNNSIMKGLNIHGGSDHNPEILSPNKSHQSANPQHSQYGKFTSQIQQQVVEEKDNLIFMRDLPNEIISPYWQKGFVWKGIFFKLYSKNESEMLKRELKSLKHLGIEYLQTESTAKIFDSNYHLSQHFQSVINAGGPFNPNTMSINESHQQENLSNNLHGKINYSSAMISVILPFITYVESSSWVLLGSAILPTKKYKDSLIDEYIQKISNENTGIFKNTFLLCNASPKNFKFFSKCSDESLMPFANTIHNNTFGTNQSLSNNNNNVNFNNQSLGIQSYQYNLGFGPTNATLTGAMHYNSNSVNMQNNTNLTSHQFVTLCNVSKLLISLPKVSTLFILNQDSNSNAIYFEFPKRGIIEFNNLKKLLGYTKLEIGINNIKKKKAAGSTNGLLISNANEQIQNDLDKQYQFEIVKFKRAGWSINMIYVNTKDPNFQRNKRAMYLLASSKSKRFKDIRGNVAIFATMSNTKTIIHPYFLSDILISSSFMEPTFIEQIIEPLDSPRIKTTNKKDLKQSLINPLSKRGEANGNQASQKTTNFNNVPINNNIPSVISNGNRLSHNASAVGGPILGMSLAGIGSKLNTENDSFRKEWGMNTSFKLFKLQPRDEKKFSEYFFPNFIKSIDYIVDYLNTQDSIINFNGLKDLFHKKGVNMRYQWIIYVKLDQINQENQSKGLNNNNRMKVMLGLDILVRTLKVTANTLTSKKLKLYKKTWMGLNHTNFNNNFNNRTGASSKRDKLEDITTEKTEFFLENYFKRIVCNWINHLLKSNNDGNNNDEDEFYHTISTNLFLNRMRVIDHAKKLLDQEEFENLVSSDIIKEILNYPFLYANLFIDAMQQHFNLSLSYDQIRQIRNDKYCYLVSPLASPFKLTDLTVIFQNQAYITIRERCFIMLLKIMPSIPTSNILPVEFNMPPSLYKMRKIRAEPQQDPQASFDCYLKDFYEVPDLEILNDWIVLLDSIFNGLFSPDGEQNFLLEAYIIQMVLSYFNENDDQASYGILEKIYAYLNGSAACSPELTITIYTWFGILSENKLLVECEQNYMMALLTLHKLYGDPRGRGGIGIPWELFITWRLSILCRLQGKIHDAEYIEELYDATILTLKDNSLNSFYDKHAVYNDPIKCLIQNEINSSIDYKSQSNILKNAKNQANFKGPIQTDFKDNNPVNVPYFNFILKNNDQQKNISLHPFTYWTQHLNFDENSSKIDVINSTLQKSHSLLKWIMMHMLTLQNTNTMWETAYLRDFYLALMQNTYTNTASVSSLSNYSLDRQGFKENKNQMIDGPSTPKSFQKIDKKKKMNQGGNLVQLFEKESSTVCKRELNGIVYSWGQNTDGQVGIPSCQVINDELITNRKLKINFPKMLTALKDSIITNIASGRVHSAAITISKNVLVWGCNKSFQLGLGENAPDQVLIPIQIPNLNNIKMVSCGTEHTAALAYNGLVYTWGQGEGGLLGHGDTRSYGSPKLLEGLRNFDISSVICGGLHTIAISKDGICYSWGRAEGGQLGIPLKELIHNPATGEVYLTTPKRIKGALENVVVTQVACGDAHSLALTHTGAVYGWGYTNSGQLGIGITSDHYDSNNPNASLQIREPTLIEKISNVRISEIFSGSTFSLFMNDRKEMYGCGLNDYYQLGLEKNTTRISNGLDNYRMPNTANKATDSGIPKKLDCFTSIPILRVACGENHSLALGLHDKYYMLFAWGMQKQGQLGLGEINSTFSLPRPIPYLQDIMIYNMACGAYHSMVILGDASKSFKKDIVIDRIMKRAENPWKLNYIENKDNCDYIINHLANDEAIIDNLKGNKKPL